MTGLKRMLVAAATLWMTAPAGADLQGVYLLTGAGTNFNNTLWMQDIPAIDGYVFRRIWEQLETAPDVYDFTDLDKMVALLETSANDQKFTIELYSHDPEPSFVTAVAATTWSYVVSGATLTRPVPWDEAIMLRFEKLTQVLADHMLPSNGVMVRLADHPRLQGVSLSVPGWGPIRDHPEFMEGGLGGPNRLYLVPGYTREALQTAVIRALKAQTDAFPAKGVFIGFWNVDDRALGLPLLADALQEDILARFDGVQNPKVGFWMENLSHAFDGTTDFFRPNTAFARILYESQGDAFIGFQALTQWSDPFNPAHVPNVEGGSPVTAMRWSLQTYNCRYFELYKKDVDVGTWDADFLAFHGELWGSPPLDTLPPARPRGLRVR